VATFQGTQYGAPRSGGGLIVRSISLLALAIFLCLAGAAYADDSSSAQSAPAVDQPVDQPADASAPTGPVLQPSDNAPTICAPGTPGFHFVEVRGTGFDAWASQRLVGNIIDANGVAQIQWGSVWVSPQGRLTLEVNLCADPFRERPALPAGDYTVSIGPGNGRTIAAAGLSLTPPAEPLAADETTAPDAAPADGTAANPAVAPTATPLPFVLPDIVAQPTPTPLPTLALPAALQPTPTPGPRTGPGSLQQPFPLGAPGNLADGWQLLVTGVTPDAWSGIHASIPSSVAPASDQRDFVVRVQATYLGQGTGVFSAMRLALLSGIQTTYNQLNNSCGIVPDTVPPNLVTSGGVTRGNVCFTVRASDINSLLLFDNQSLEGDRAYFALN
jgi:hypothetical protein